MIIGIDEVGRGSWAGPVCVAAVALDSKRPLPQLTDSKLLTPKVRRELAVLIKQHALFVGVGWASSQEVDAHGLTWALRKAGLIALTDSRADDLLLLDGHHNYLQDDRVSTVVKGDLLYPEISAASIIAKVARDNFMAMAAQKFAQYGFEQHVGYGTQGHQKALAEHGPCRMHRERFAPIKLLLNGEVT